MTASVWTVGGAPAGTTSAILQEFRIATAGQTAFTLYQIIAVDGTNNVLVSVDGLWIPFSDYVITDTDTITFLTPMVGGEEVQFVGIAVNLGGAFSTQVSYTGLQPGAIPRQLTGRLNELPSVLDFGADPLGVIDSAPMIQAGIDALFAIGGGQLFLPEGQYKLAATLQMKRGVSLVGPLSYLSIGQIYNGSALEAVIAGVAVLRPTAAISTQAVTYNFQAADRSVTPYGACLFNLLIDSRDQSNGDCVYVNPPLPAQGPFNSGFGSDSIEFHNCVFRGAPRYGFRIESTATENINAYFYNCRFGLNGSHGLYALRCFDIKLFWCYLFENGGDGAYLDGCAVERVVGSDFFNNDGNAITLDGFDGRYVNCAFENNNLHGVRVICSTSGQVQKRYRFTDCRFGTNGFLTNNTYDNFHLSDLAGAGISGITWVNCLFGLQAHVGTANRVRAEIYSTALPAQAGNSMTGCQVNQNDLNAGNTYFNETFWQSCNFETSFAPDGNQLAAHYRPFDVWAGGAAPNTIRGVTNYKTANVAAATITGLANGSAASVQGRDVWILIDDANTGVDFSGTTLRGNGGVDLAAPATGKLIHFKNVDGTNWNAVIYG